MELKVDDVLIPEKIGFNYKELKEQLTTRCDQYATIVYTDDTIKEAKVDRAMLNKLKDNLNAERLRRQREYMHPFDVFKSQIDDLIGIIDRASGSIDRQVKDYEDRQKQQKAEEIKKIFDNVFANSPDAPDWLTYDMIANPKWLLKSKTLKAVQGEIEDRIGGITQDCKMIASTFADDPYKDAATSAAMATYKKYLDFRTAVNAGSEIHEEMVSAEKRQKAREAVETEKMNNLPSAPEKPVSVDENTVPEAVTEKPEPRRERTQKVVVQIIAKESQFDAVNALFAGLRQAGAEFEILSKEEI